MSQVIAVLNQKGGVGKTTTTINLAAYLVKLKKTVLIVDLDPQGNATSGVGIDKTTLANSTNSLLMGQSELNDIVIKTEQGIDIAPANISLADAEINLAASMSRETVLANKLNVAQYDYILIDCPPSLGLLTVNALSAANWLLVPVQAEYYALEGLSQLLDTMQKVKQSVNAELELMGVVATMVDSRTSLSDHVIGELEKYFGERLLRTKIPRNVKLAEAPSYGIPISEYEKWSKGARAYKALAKEVAERAEK